jgi:hypothetical protein
MVVNGGKSIGEYGAHSTARPNFRQNVLDQQPFQSSP